MSVSPSIRTSIVPYIPGAWPGSAYDHHDDNHNHDTDVSSVSSYGSIVAYAPVRRDSARKSRRRWTYAGYTHSYTQSTDWASAIRANSPAPGMEQDDSKMSPSTEATISTAMSSPLNTPDITDWPTRLGAPSASQSLLLDNIPCPNLSPSSVTRFDKNSPSQQEPSAHHTLFLSRSASRDTRFPSPHLDPPLLNFIPGLPPLRLPLSDVTVDFPYQESHPGALSPPSEACSTPSSFILPFEPRRDRVLPSTNPYPVFGPSSVDLAIDFFPVSEIPEPSPHMTVSSVSESQVSRVDSPVLPPISVEIAPELDYMRLAPPISDMDAFALAAAVASSSNSRSSFSIPPSIRSTAAVPTTATNGVPSEYPRPHAYRLHSSAFEASTSNHSRPASYSREMNPNPPGQLSHSLDHRERPRARRLSAPPPSLWRASPRPQPVRTVSTRVDAGMGSVADQRDKHAKQPVMGKVRKFGERIRGFFKNNRETPFRVDPAHVGSTPEYSMMTTTTAVTNVEYESEHPIPLPSPRAKIMRNRRSLPIQSFFPSGLDRTLLKSRADPSPSLLHPPIDLTRSDNSVQQETQPTDPRRSPHTPRPRRERTHTAPQTTDSERKPSNERKARRFSLSSALTKTRIDSVRSTGKSRPPMPKYTPSARDEAGSATQASWSENFSASSTVGHEVIVSAPPEGEPFWGEELPNVTNTCNIRVANSVTDSPTRSRTQMMQHHPVVPSTPRDKRTRRFSLSSVMAKRSTRTPDFTGRQTECSSPSGAKKTRKLSRRRPRGDTVTGKGTPRPKLDLDIPSVPNMRTSTSNRSSLVSSSAESTYHDAREQLTEPDHDHGLALFRERSSSPRPESDLDSMSFARTPDYSSGTFSFGSSTEREYYHYHSEPSMSVSRLDRRYIARRIPGSSAVSHLVGESVETPITKTLRFSPSLSLSFDMSCSDFGDEDALRGLDVEEDLSFMRALGFEFDQIVRRVREEPL